jgi:type II secretory pathway pseudopilin PulG
MKFGTPSPISGTALTGGRSRDGFTLAEVLAALLFMAIVIPVALEAMHVASRAGTVAERKSEAARVAGRILNENIANTNWNSGGSQSGTVNEGLRQFNWSLNNDSWDIDRNLSTMRLLSVEVKYVVQGQNYSVRLSTLVDSAPPTSPTQ